MKEAVGDGRNTRASRAQVFAAADQALKSGRRPTQDGVRSALGGGSLTSINTHLNEWYADLGARLARAEQPVGGVPPEANELLQQLWWLALKGRGAGAVSGGESEEVRMMRAQRDAAMAQSSALQTLNGELGRQRASAERSLADTRALLMRREAALEEEMAARLQLEQEVASLRLQGEFASLRRDAASTKRQGVAAGAVARVGRGTKKAGRKKTSSSKASARRANNRRTSKRAKGAGRSGSGLGRRRAKSGRIVRKGSGGVGKRKGALKARRRGR